MKKSSCSLQLFLLIAFMISLMNSSARLLSIWQHIVIRIFFFNPFLSSEWKENMVALLLRESLRWPLKRAFWQRCRKYSLEQARIPVPRSREIFFGPNKCPWNESASQLQQDNCVMLILA